jgi:DNA circularisation protein N-terminus
MANFDLNNPIDFARATNSFGAGILQTFTARGQQQWLLKEGQYTSADNSQSVVFHVLTTKQDYGGAMSQVSDQGGRRKAKFEFPFVDGQLTSDLGRLAETFQLDIVLHGNNYLRALRQLLEILQNPVPGKLIHPVRGPIRCAMESYELTHQESQRKAVSIRLTMIEHSLETQQILGEDPVKSAPTRLSRLTEAFKKIEDAINAVQGSVFLITSVKNQIVQGLQDYQNAYSRLTGNMNATFNPGGASIPALLPTQEGGLQGGDGQIVSNSVTIAVSPNDPLQNLPADVLTPELQQALAIDTIEKQVGNSRLQVADIIDQMKSSADGQGALIFYSNIIDLRVTANELLLTFEAGKKSSRSRVIDYVTPQVMSVREIAFANGLSPDEGSQIALLNPSLESVNLVPKGLTVRVGVS